MKRKTEIIRIISTIIFALLLFYITIPAINFQSPGFWAFLLTIVIFYIFASFIKLFDVRDIINNRKTFFKKYFYLVGGIIAVSVIIFITNLVVSPLFNSKSYANRIKINQDGDFTKDIATVDFNAIPLLDKTSSQKLGDRVMGQMSELVSQFYVSDLYTQINYNNEIVRVTPLEYVDVIKYFTNRKEGITGYITVNSVNGESKLVKLDKGMRYMPSALFNEKLSRKLRFSYPTEIFDTASFEIDNEGNPYWIVPTIKYVGVGKKKEINGVVILNPITGSSKKYSVQDVPTWVDHVYSANLIIEQIDDWGQYQKGFINSLFGQKGVVMTTDGYNYMTLNDDVYLYTGITSVVSDESNLGFILCNMRTKETTYYQVSGAEEYSAMASAEGQVQQMSYISSFPLLINLNNKPTYLMSLKDNAGLVKMYAFVDVADYQKVTVTDSSLGINKAAENYLLSNKGDYSNSDITTETIIISKINTALIEGNTYYYIIDNNSNKYKASIATNSNLLPFLGVGDSIEITYLSKNNVTEILSVK